MLTLSLTPNPAAPLPPPHYYISFPSHFESKYLTSFHMMVMKHVINVITALIDKPGSDIRVYHNVAQSLTFLIPMYRGKLFNEHVAIHAFEVSVYCLEKMLTYIPGMNSGVRVDTSSHGSHGGHTGSIVQVLEPLIDSFGTTARLFALFVIQEAAAEGSSSNTRSEKKAMMVSVRRKMQLLLANRSVSPLCGLESHYLQHMIPLTSPPSIPPPLLLPHYHRYCYNILLIKALRTSSSPY